MLYYKIIRSQVISPQNYISPPLELHRPNYDYIIPSNKDRCYCVTDDFARATSSRFKPAPLQLCSLVSANVRAKHHFSNSCHVYRFGSRLVVSPVVLRKTLMSG